MTHSPPPNETTSQERKTALGPILSFGEALIDLIVADGSASLKEASTFDARAGGAPANVAAALARLGLASGFCGVVGDDPFGWRLRDTLAGEGVNVSRLRSTDAAETTIAFAWKDRRGDGHFRLLRGADTLLTVDDVDRADVPHASAVVVGSVALAAQPSGSSIAAAVKRASGAGIPVCFDVNLRPTIWADLATARAACEPIFSHATVIKLSLDDANGLLGASEKPEDAVDRLRKTLPAANGQFSRQVVLTDGSRGCWFGSDAPEGPIKRVPALPVDAIEPTGAGDAFTAALVSRLLAQEWAPLTEDDVRYAAAAGALATTRPGALDGLPTANELDAFLASQ